MAALLLFLFAVHIQGCLQSSELTTNSSPPQAAAPAAQARLGPLHSGLELDFESSLSQDLFRTWGSVVLWSNSSLPYLMLNSSLMKDGRLVESTRYLLIDVQPGRPFSFEICESGRYSPAEGYSCLLEASGPQGPLQSEARQCQAELEQSPESARDSRFEIEYYYRYLAQSEEEIFSRENDDRYQEDLPSPGGRQAGEPIGPDRDSVSSDEEARSLSDGDDGEGFVGSKTSKKYHLPTCRYAVKILPEKRLVFASREEAESRGYEPCKVCNP
ncbi:MAG: hypothetical protein GKC10_09675 [Methanosarcinales archaeon]|nr:hypothetical protein [Methanosarcinales archaeon]